MKNSDVVSVEGPSGLIQTSVLCARSSESKDGGLSPSTAAEEAGGFGLPPEPLWASVSAVKNWEYFNELLTGIKSVCEVLPARPGSPSNSLRVQEPAVPGRGLTFSCPLPVHDAVATSHPEGSSGEQSFLLQPSCPPAQRRAARFPTITPAASEQRALQPWAFPAKWWKWRPREKPVKVSDCPPKEPGGNDQCKVPG